MSGGAIRLVPYEAAIGAQGCADGQSPVRLCDARRLDAQPDAGVLARIGVVADACSIDLRDTATCLQRH